MLRVGLTGNLGAGKSTVGAFFRGWGGYVIDADALAREAVAPGSPALAEIEAAFGAQALAPDGTLDRAALRRRVAVDPGARRRLEAILHPRIRARLLELLGEAGGGGAAIAVASIPLLFESGMEGEFDAVVLVDAPEETRVSRVVATGRMSEAEARAIAAAQRPASEKRAHFVIENDDDLATLERRARDVWDRLVAREEASR